MAQSGSNKKVANSLVAVSAAAVMSVYAAGYSRTKNAAARLDALTDERRPAVPEATRDSPAPIASPPGEVPTPTTPQPERSSTPVSAPIEVASVTAPSSMPLESATPAPAAPAVTVPATVAPPGPEVASTVPVPAPVEPAPVPAAPVAAAKWKDGTYTGWGTCRHGDIQASVVIEGGRITSARISQCLTRYSCDVIGRLPPEVLQRQSAEVDYVSGATQSANAFYYAVVEALGKAK